MDYIELHIEFKTVDPWRDILVSQLAEKGFESFVETKTGLLGYIPETAFKNELVEDLNQVDAIENYVFKKIVDENWNAEWEKNFNPVYVEDKLAILAPFHDKKEGYELTITIQPQMSFGTGHHQTTWLASKRLFELDLQEKAVLDMGTGTGILAILAEKRGAKIIFAPDIDEWSYNNALENVSLNQCQHVTVALGDDTLLNGKAFDLIIANINKNILISHFPTYAKSMLPNGNLLISGFFETDKDDLIAAAAKSGFVFEWIGTKDEWALMQFSWDEQTNN